MVKRPSLLARFGKEKISYQNLARLNTVVATVFGLQALAILIISDSQKGTLGITTNYLTSDTLLSEASAHQVNMPATQHLFDLKLAYVLAALLLAAAAGRWIAGSFRRKKYESGLRRGLNKHSWTEHGVITALVMVTVGLVSGILDLVSLLFIIWLSAMAAWLGYKFEQYILGAKRTDWQILIAALKAGAWVWLAVFIYMAGALIWGRGLPPYIYWVYASMVLIFIGYSYNTYCAAKKTGRWSNSLWSERVYVVLTLVGVSALAWQVFAGALR